MKRFTYIILSCLSGVLLLASSCNDADSQNNAETVSTEVVQTASATDTEQVVDLAVEGMHCDNCVQAIQGTVAKLDGVSSVEAEFESGHALVSYNPAKISEEQISAEIESLGFSVSGHYDPDAAAVETDDALEEGTEVTDQQSGEAGA